MLKEEDAIRKALVELLRGGNAHASLQDAVKDFPVEFYAKKPPKAPHNAWQLLEHMRITVHDLLDFCRNPKYSAPEWPADYWPRNPASPSSDEWDASVKALRADLRDFEVMIEDKHVDLSAQIPWGDGPTILREILLAADHTSYHVGQLVLLRIELGIWKG